MKRLLTRTQPIFAGSGARITWRCKRRPPVMALVAGLKRGGRCARYVQSFPFGGTREASIQTNKLDRFRPAPRRA